MWRARACLSIVYWAARFEAVIRTRRVDQLVELAGIRLDATSPRPGTCRQPSLSARDVFVLRAVHRLYRRSFGERPCLRECLVSGRLLRYRSPALRLGVRSAARSMQAHAWLEFDGVAVDPLARDYVALVAGARTHSAS
ncbi:lasso peptide biosynthesis B2 protein [uncultured Jatrophihabitans sp.]|uniref:lasso peptide biosynthesis B2 protein n=1 Tax=uncultured Jatrophihabitans sp. TaxID=1610747 RepID=UPI0035C94FB2